MDILDIRYIIEVMDIMDIIDIIDIMDIMDIMIITAGLAMAGAVSALVKMCTFMGDLKGAPAVHIIFPLQTFFLYIIF